MPAWLPDQGLLRLHHDYGTWATDAPPIFHVAAMLPSLAAVCADKARLVIDNQPFPLHVWSMLVGRSTADRKTTATRLASQRIDRGVGNRSRIQGIHGSPEGLLQGLVLQPCICLYIPEGGAFFAQREASYWKHAREMIMDLYDDTDVFERKLVKDTIRVRDPRISILAACALPLLRRYTRDTDWLGGFLARFLMIAGDPLPHKKRPRRDPHVEAQIETMVNNVYLANWGTMGVTSGARTVLDDFSTEIHEGLKNYPDGLGPSLNRLAETSNRLAGLYEIARQADKPPAAGQTVLVTTESAQAAVALCRASRDVGLADVAEMTVEAGFSRDLTRIEGLIRRAGLGGVARTTLLRATRFRARDLDVILNTLLESDLLSYSIARTDKPGRTAQKFVHVEAADDTKKLAMSALKAPGAPIAYVDFRTGLVNIDALPAITKPPPWATVIEDDEDIEPGSMN
jgi:hypothetical protein